MRRPIIFLFLFFAFGIALEYQLMLAPFHFWILTGILSAVCFLSKIVGWQTGRVEIICLFLVAMLMGSLYFYLAEHHQDPLEAAEGKYCTVKGRIITVQIKDDTSYKMLITTQSGRKRLVQVKGFMEHPADSIGKWAVIKGKVTLPSEQRNPGLFDYRLYLKTKGVRVILQSDYSQIVIEQRNASALFSSLARLKYGFQNKLKAAVAPEAFGLMVGMLFGDRSFIGDDTYEVFQKNGIAHILSVSGIHVGIVYLFISRLFGNRKTRTFYVFVALILFSYAALSEFSPSVVRAVVMIYIHMFSKVSYRRYDFISCTATSALGMLLLNPFYLFNTGFQLSFMAVFCLAAMLPWMNRKLARMEERGKSERITAGLRYLSPLLIIQGGMAPMTAYLFNYFSITAFFINIPIIAIAGLIIPLGICLIPISFLGGPLFGVGAGAAELLIRIMLWLNELFFFPGIGFFNVVSPSILFLLIFYGFFFFLSSEFFRILYQRKRKKAIPVYCVLILIFSLLISMTVDNGYHDAELIFLDVGQGDCLHIRTPEGRNILIDGGGSQHYKVGEKILFPYLLKNGVKSIDLAIVTHLHDDHYLGIKELAGKMEIKKLGIYDANRLREKELLDDTGLKSENLLYLAEGDRIRMEKDIWIDVLYPEEKSAEDYMAIIMNEEEENNSCLFMKVYYKGLTVMMTGDIGMEGEEEIMDYYHNDPKILDVDVLKVGHHGSKYSTGNQFLEAVNPKIAVFQVGKNNFGHPHPSVIEKCTEKGIMIHRNDFDGAIILTEEGRQWHTKVLLQGNMHIKE